MGLVLVTPPMQEPLGGQELLEHVRELDTEQRGYLLTLGIAAREHVEAYCRRALLSQTWKLVLDAFPCDDFLRLPRPPLQSVTSVKYIDGSGVQQTWASTNYVVDTASLPGRVRLAYGISWPFVRTQPNAVEITYIAGYGDAPEDVPESLKHGLKLWVGNLYENREPLVTGTIAVKLPMSVEALLGPYRVLEF
jgi:uncharacterized phiE125 gp8 family phage protein